MEPRTFIDTHVACWLYEGKIEKISKTAYQILERNILSISPISILELDYLFEIKRINKKGKQIFQQLQSLINIHTQNDYLEDLIERASEIHWTRDVFDRLISAHASLHKAHLITKDQKIREYYKNAIW